MNSTSPFTNTISTLHIVNASQTHGRNISNQWTFNYQTTEKVKKIIRNHPIRSKHNNIPRSKRSNTKTIATFDKNNKTSFASPQSSLPPSLSSSIYPSEFGKLMEHIDINDDPTKINSDPQSNNILKPLEGLEEKTFYPEVVTEGKKTVDQILTKLRSSQSLEQAAQEKNWEDLAKALQVIHKYQRSKYLDPKSIDIMQSSLESLARFFSETPITTKVQFLAFKNWISIASYNLSNSVGFNNFSQARIYLIKLDEIMSSSNKEMQEIVHNYSNVLFKYQFLGQCLDEGCIVKKELFTVMEKTFNFCEKLKEQKYYYFVRNALMAFEDIIKSAEKSAFKNEIINRLEQGFKNFFNRLTSEEKIVVKRLSYLIIKSIKGQNITALSKFCQETTIKDIYPYQREIFIGNMGVNITSALDWKNDLMKQLPGKLQKTYSRFKKEFGKVLDIADKELIKCNLYVAESKSLYEIFNYALLGKSTGNGGVTECIWEERSCLPAAAVYRQDNEIRNLEHEFNHILLHLHAGLKVNHPMDKFKKYGRLDWLNEGLSYVLVPNNFMEKTIENGLIDRGLPNIKGIIEADSQDYSISYSFVDYLLNKQKPILDKILVYAKDKKEDLLIGELENLNSLESDYHTYLMARWNLPESTRKSTTKPSHPLSPTTIGPITAKSIPTGSLVEDIRIKYVGWTPEKGWDAVKKIIYGSTALLGLGLANLVYAIFGMSKKKGGNGRGGHNRFRAMNRRGYRNEPAKYPEAKPLREKQKPNKFFPHDSKSSQR